MSKPGDQPASAQVTADTCQLCGQPTNRSTEPLGHDGQHGDDAAFMLDPFDGHADDANQGQPAQSEATRTPRFGRWGIAAAVAAIGLIGFGIGSLIDSSDQPSDDENGEELAEESDAVFDRDEAGLFGDDELAGETGDDAPFGDPNFPPSDEHLDDDEISLLFTDRLGGGSAFAVAYVADDGLHTLGPWGTAQPTVATAHTLDQALGNPLLSDGSQTWAIDDAKPELAYVVSARFEVVETQLSGNLAFIRKEGDQIEVGMTAYGGRQPGVRIPRESDVLAVPGRGLLIAPATGGTFVVGQGGDMVKLSDDRAVSAGIDSEVYQRCDEALVCELYASAVDPEGTTILTFLDFQADTPVTISPDGAYVVGPSLGTGTLRMTGIYEEQTINLGDQTVLATGWAPDSSFLAVAVPGQLLIAPVNGDELLSVPLPADPSSGELLVFNL